MRYEDIVSLNQDLTFEYTQKEFDKVGLPFENNNKKTLGVINEEGVYTNLALLLSEQCNHTIKLAVFQGVEKVIFKDRREFTGSVLKQLRECFEHIMKYNAIRSEFEGLDRIDIMDYPIEAIREVLLNVIVHRDYSFSGSTLISIFDDRIEFVSIGGLVKGLYKEDLQLGVSMLRNKNLGNVFYRLKLIEAYGTGIIKMNKEYKEYNIEPIIEISNNAFKITLPNVNYMDVRVNADKKISDKEKKVMQLFTHNHKLTRKEIENTLDISQATTSRILTSLIKKGYIRKIGTGTNTIYKKYE